MDSTSTVGHLLDTVVAKDASRARRNETEHSRGASALPMSRLAIFAKLYGVLPRAVMRLLEAQWERKARQQLVSADTTALSLRGSTRIQFTNPPRVRKVQLDEKNVLHCSCGHYDRFLETNSR